MKEINGAYGFIYITTNMVNGRRYIGQRKFSDGWRCYLGSGHALKEAIKKYGRKEFKRDIVDIAYSKEELDYLEIDWIKNCNAVKSRNYYNIALGGNGVHLEKSYNTKEVVCLNTGICYGSMMEAGKKNKVDPSSISACCNGKILSAGENYKGTKLVWTFYEDYIKMSMIEIANKINYAQNSGKGKYHYKAKKVVCLNDKKVFNTITDAADYYNLNYTHITSCCTGKRRFCGRNKETNQQLAWAYYENFLKMSNKEIEQILSQSNKKPLKKEKKGSIVLCVTTGKIFDSAKKASEFYHIDSSAIIKNCNKKVKSAGSLNGERLIWEYIHKCKSNV